MAGFEDSAPLMGTGIKCAGTKYMFIVSDNQNIRGRLGGDGGITAHKTNQARADWHLQGARAVRRRRGRCRQGGRLPAGLGHVNALPLHL